MNRKQAIGNLLLGPLALLLALAMAAPAAAGEDPPALQPINPWYGNGSPFVFSESERGEKLVKVGNQEYWILTPEKLATDPNPGLTHRNVALIGELGNWEVNKKDRYWKLELAGDKTVYTHGPNSYEENLDMILGLRIGYHAMLVGQAKLSADQKGSVLVVSKAYRIPAELERYQSLFAYRQQNQPDYEVFKVLADELDQKATKARANNDGLADQFKELREQVIDELLSNRAALLTANQLNVEEMFEYMTTILRYRDDRSRAAEVLKRILKKEPNHPKIKEAVVSLLPDWVLCQEAKQWMPRVECEKLRATRLAEIEKQRQAELQRARERMDAVAMNSNLRHVVMLQNQAAINNHGYALPAADAPQFKQLTELLAKSDDYRLVQQVMLQAVAQVETKEWIRLIEPALQNANTPVRILAYRLGAYSEDLPTVRRLALALRTDQSNMIKDDAVQAMCQTRAKTTVQALVDCLLNSTDDALNASLLAQLQRLTNRKDTEKDAWNKYVSDPGKIQVVPE